MAGHGNRCQDHPEYRGRTEEPPEDCKLCYRIWLKRVREEGKAEGEGRHRPFPEGQER